MRACVSAVVLAAWTICANPADAGMGPCVPADFDLICGSGEGAAHVIVKTISPSKRLAFAWRLTDRPPGAIPAADDPHLENFVIRIADGAVLAKSHGAYWDLSTKIAKAYLMTVWSADSSLLVKVEQRAEFRSAEVFAFDPDDAAIGPFDLAPVIKSAVLAAIGVRDSGGSVLVFTARPAMTIDDRGLLQATVFVRDQDARDSEAYAVRARVTRAAGSLDAKVVSVTPYPGASVSVIVH
jgi:hypothetical protein